MRPLILCALLSMAASPALAEPLFSAFRPQAGPAPTQVEVKDLNLDGHLDLVTVDGASSVSVLLGTGGGAFAPATLYAIAAAAFRAVVADVDANGTLDIVTANPSTNNVSILFGDGYGAFSAGPNLTTGTSPWGVVVGDVNGDLRPDIVTANNGTNTISVIRQTTPAGSFLAKTDFAFGNNPTSLALGDIDGDLDLDVVASRSGTSVAARLFNNGAGSFAVGSSIENHDRQIDVALVDVNGNGVLDALFLCPGGVRVHLGNGNGTFQPYVNRTVPTGNYDFEVGDVNGDTKPDLLVGGGPPISLLVGNGNGTFQAARTTYAFAAGVGLGDIDEDGLVDLVGVGSDPPNGPLPGPVVMLAYPDLVFGWRFAGGTSDYGTDVADMNQDGRPDLIEAATPGECSNTCPQTEVWVLLGTGANPFVAPIVGPPLITVPVNPNGLDAYSLMQDLRVGDFNDDDLPDVVIRVGRSGLPHIITLIGNGAGGFSSQVATPAGDVPLTGTGDFDRDGHLDVMQGNRLWRGVGDGTFLLHPTPAPLSGPFLVLDLDRDGRLDLIAAAPATDQVAIAAGVGNGTFLAPTSFAAGDAPNTVVAADVDRNGTLDLVVTSPVAATISVLPGDGLGGFGTPIAYGAASDVRSLAIADLDGDGWVDVAARGTQLTVLRGLGGGLLGNRVDYDPKGTEVGYDPDGTRPGVRVFVRDMNEDDKPDVLLASGGFTYLQNMGDGITLDTPSPRPVPTAFAVWPNPARGAMRFALVVQEPGPVTLEIFDLAGRIVATPFRGPVPAGRTEVAWRGAARAGVYWARFTSTAQVVTRRVVTLGD